MKFEINGGDFSKEITNEMLEDGYTGQGTFTYNGDKYVGEFKDGMFHGNGTDTYASGDKYVGELKVGKMHGQGTFTYAIGDKYAGEFKDNLQHGKGTFTWSDGDKYAGEFKDDKKNGKGTFTFASGNKYVGEFKDDNFHGKGTFTFTSGNKYVGEMFDGVYINTWYKPTSAATEEVESEEVTSSEEISISYADSLNHKAEALDLKTSMQIIEQYLSSPYRWVRETAAKHPTIDKEWIEKSMKDHEELSKEYPGPLDRYVLKGIVNNPNCTSVIRDKISVLIEDEERYPINSDQYELQFTSTCFITGELRDSVSFHSVAEAIINGGDWEDYIESSDSDWRDFARDDEYGPTTLVDWVIYPDGSESNIDLDNFYPEEFGPVEGGANYSQVGTFLDFRSVIDKGSWIDYIFDLEYEFNPKYLKPIFNEHSMCGIVSSYEYDNKETGDFEDDITGEYEESRPGVGGDISLFENTKKGLKQIWNFKSLKEEMVMKKINVTDLTEVTEFLNKKFNQ